METRKYYWIKLRKDFFERDDIDFILSQEKGCEYIVLYQMLCMKASNNEGLLGTKINEIIVPYDVKKITRDCKYFDYDTIVVALELYKRLGLVYEEDNKVLKITDYDNLVGSETAWAEKKRIYREKQKLLRQKKDNVLEDIDKEIDKELDIDNNSSISFIEQVENEFGTLSSLQYEELYKLKDDFGEELVLEALKECAINNVRTIKYLKGILNNWKKDNVKSVEDLKKTKKTTAEEQPIELFEYDWTQDDESI